MSEEATTTFDAASLKPLEKIALTFSGGGYRAAGFCLGVLAYLNRITFKGKPLLQNVEALSTVSSGTITGAYYASCVGEGVPFEGFYDKLYGFLNEDKVLDVALEKLKNQSFWKDHHKKRSMANGFAEAYRSLLTDRNFDFLLEDTSSHLKDIMFNASEFNNGNVFRFQTKGVFGNVHLACPELDAVKNHILVADAIAASSNFPLAFEPIIFPDDFLRHDLPEYVSLKRLPEFRDGLGLMDGGIVDNQGVNSIIKADERRRKSNEQFDLLMICDVSGLDFPNWVQEEQKPISGWRQRTISNIGGLFSGAGKWKWVLWSIFGVGILFTAIAEKGSLGGTMIWIGGMVTGISLTLIFFVLVLNLSLTASRAIVNFLIGLIPTFVKTRLGYLESLPLGVLEQMLKERFTSTVTMVSDVFMKQVRRLTYFQVYENENWKYRRTAVLIDALTDIGFSKKQRVESSLFEFLEEELKVPGEKIQNSALIATNTSTTLWFTEGDRKVERLNHLIACGQFTTCFNLLYYLSELKNDPNSPLYQSFKDNENLMALYNALLEDWKRFKKDPLFMI